MEEKKGLKIKFSTFVIILLLIVIIGLLAFIGIVLMKEKETIPSYSAMEKIETNSKNTKNEIANNIIENNNEVSTNNTIENKQVDINKNTINNDVSNLTETKLITEAELKKICEDYSYPYGEVQICSIETNEDGTYLITADVCKFVTLNQNEYNKMVEEKEIIINGNLYTFDENSEWEVPTVTDVATGFECPIFKHDDNYVFFGDLIGGCNLDIHNVDKKIKIILESDTQVDIVAGGTRDLNWLVNCIKNDEVPRRMSLDYIQTEPHVIVDIR